MIIKRKSNSKEFVVTPDEWSVVVGAGMSDKYDIIGDDKPIELKRLKVEQPIKEEKHKNEDAGN